MIKLEWMRSCFLWMCKKSGFLRWKLLLVVNAVKIGETTAKKLEYYINLVDNAAAGFKNIGYNSERSSIVGKMRSSSIIFTEKSSMKGRINQCNNLHCCFKKLGHSHPTPWQPSS